MSRPASITQDQVSSAAAGLRAEGTNPSWRAVRDRLGTGSPAVIQKFLRVWKGEQPAFEIQSKPLPPDVQRLLSAYIEREIVEASAALQSDLKQVQHDNLDLIAESEQLQQHLDRTEGDVQAERQAREKLEGQAAQLQTDLVVCRTELAAERIRGEQARTELAKCLLKLEALAKLESQNAELSKELAKAVEDKVIAERSMAVLQEKDRTATAAYRELKEESKLLKAQLDAMQKLLDSSRQELSNERVAVHAASSRLESVSRELETAKSQAMESRLAEKAALETATELRIQLKNIRRA